jgi:hypothetical protein
MGDRGQVRIIGTNGPDSPDLYFYTHWYATDLESIVSDALDAKRGRWADNEYLNRGIFSQMIKDDILSETGYGIGFEPHGDVWKLVVVNHLDKTAGVMKTVHKVDGSAGFTFEHQNFDWVQEPVPYKDFVLNNKSVSI